jgi:hypothetical protein
VVGNRGKLNKAAAIFVLPDVCDLIEIDPILGGAPRYPFKSHSLPPSLMNVTEVKVRTPLTHRATPLRRKERLDVRRVDSLRGPSIGVVAKQRLQPMNDFTNNVAWWLSIDALTIAMMFTITFTVVWLAR